MFEVIILGGKGKVHLWAERPLPQEAFNDLSIQSRGITTAITSISFVALPSTNSISGLLVTAEWAASAAETELSI